MQTNNKFRLSVLALGVLGALGSGQAMAEALTSNATYYINGNNDASNHNEGVVLNSAADANGIAVSRTVDQGTVNEVTYVPNNSISVQTNGITINAMGTGTETISNTGIALIGTTAVTGRTSITGATSVTGTLTSTGNTTLGTAANSVNTIGTTGSTNTLQGVTNTLQAATNTITGTTNINTTGTAATTIGNRGSAGTEITSGYQENPADNSYTYSRISSNQSVSSITTTNVVAGNETSYGLNVSATGRTVGDSGDLNSDYRMREGSYASQAVVTNALGAGTVNNIIQGNTLIDGNVYINGSLTYSSNSSATTTVTGTGATGTTSAGTSVVNAGQAGGVAIDANGKLTAGATPTQTTSALTVTNGLGNTHGFVVNETQATMSGGTRSTSMTLNDGGAFFSNSATGAPVRVTGVRDGASDFDAVNYRQLRQVYAGVAGTAAMANIPQVDQNKTFAVGVGLGNFQGMNAVAIGASYRVAPNAVLKASVSSVNGDGNNVVAGIGAGFSW